MKNKCLNCENETSAKRRKYCSHGCAMHYRFHVEAPPVLCRGCGLDLRGKLAESRDFCGRDCYGSWLSKHQSGRARGRYKPGKLATALVDRGAIAPKTCIDCGASVSAHSYSRCSKCKNHKIRHSSFSKSLAEIANAYKAKSHVYYARIRTLLRVTVRAEKSKTGKCLVCGYDKYTELCHIKPISAFPMEAKLSEVNSLYNISELCPNCHKEQELFGLEVPSLGDAIGRDHLFIHKAS